MNSSATPNRLIREKSPYLLQHAYNPVDWYPWGEEAFEKARREDKPVFLSIGYSTCHWCHVMEHESFEDAEVAALMNEAFVSIKVDREERPDIDNIYMTVCQMLAGSGGWPLTIVMTPDRKPFFATTYVPKHSRFGRSGMMDLAPRLREVWSARREEVLKSADQITFALQEAPDTAGDQPGKEELNLAMEQMAQRFDTLYAGFGSAPKFPTPHQLLFLLRYWKRTGHPRALEMAEKTLRAMRLGGIYDQLGFGFHRYSTDRQWLVPHFEKMLYDQAMLTMACTDAHMATGKAEYRDTACEVLTYVLRDMTAPEGGFYSAEDADSEGEEGKFYVWTTSEIRVVLPPDDARFIISLLNVSESGNWVDQTTGDYPGTNILNGDEMYYRLTAEEKEKFQKLRELLFTEREKRIHPHKDDKILTDWNGLMIAALARAGRAFGIPEYIRAAERASRFLVTTMRNSDGGLHHRFRAGEAGLPAHIDDYAFAVWGFIELYQASRDAEWLSAAMDLNRYAIEHFWDETAGGFFFTSDRNEELLARTKEVYDGAVPSGNSVAMWNLVRLARMTGASELEEKADRLARAFSARVKTIPFAHTQFLIGVDFAMGPSYEVVIAGDPDAADTAELLHALNSSYHPNHVLVFRPTDSEAPRITELAPYTRLQKGVDGKAAAYVCRGGSCDAPVTSAQAMLNALR